ncbi:MAG: hypothetical protein Q9190_000493 [Brigantiaea leucoxantha]
MVNSPPDVITPATLRNLSNPPSQAHRIITQVLVVGTRVLGRAFLEAYRQASYSSKYYKATVTSQNPSEVHNLANHGLTLDEACKILNVAPPRKGQTELNANVMERFKRLFDVNEPKNGGSFYLQSKILRARERIEMEIESNKEDAEHEKNEKEGWNPKVYKNR